MKKVIKIVSGPNGSGKTTFAESLLVRQQAAIPFLNPDLIAAGLDTGNQAAASFQAGRILLEDIKDKLSKGDSFSFESTLSGRTYAKIIEEARKNDYSIEIYFLFLQKVTQNISRIKKRVEQGGHHIPTQVVRRRYLKCFQHFWTLYRPLSDNWMIFDNSSTIPKLLLDKKSFDSLSSDSKLNFEKRFLKGKP